MESELQETAFFHEITGLKKERISKLDPQCRFTRVSKFFSEITGYSGKELEGKRIHDFLTWDSLETLTPIYNARLSAEADGIKTGVISTDLEVVHKDGSVILMEFVISPERDDQSRISGFFLFSREIPEKIMMTAIPENDEMFRLFMSNFPGLAYIKDSRGITLYANEGFRTLLGLDPALIIGKRTEEIFPPEMAEGMLEDDRKVLDTGQITVREEEVAGKVWFTRKFRIHQRNNEFLLGGLTYDITERIMNQKAVNLSEERLRRAELAAGFGNWEFRLEDGSVFASEGARRIYGLGEEDWTIENVKKLPLPEYREMLDKALSALINENKPYDVEFVIRRPSDKQLISIHSLARYEPETRTVTGVIQDISQRKSAEEAFWLKSEELNRFFHTSLDLFCIADQDTHIVALNPQWQTTLGYSLDSMIGQSLLDYVHPDDMTATLSAISLLGTQNQLKDFVNRYRCRDGSYRWIEWRANVADTLVYSAARDITDHKNQEAALKEAMRKAEESDRLKSAFLANISHEIRTPMNGIVGFAEMLGDKGITETERDEFLQIINDSSRQLLRIVNDVLDISRIEAGEMVLKYSDQPLQELFDELSHIYKPLCLKKGIDFRIDCQIRQEFAVLHVDVVKLRQILDNLLGNALKFTVQGSITLGCVRKEPGILQFNVEDTGPGVPLESRDKIFERFHQVPQNGNTGSSGTGLGLPIARALARLMGGDMWLDPDRENGALFSFALPFVNTVERSISPESQEPKTVSPGETILVVEDEEMNWQYTLAALKGSGYRIIHADCGQEALRLYHEENPELVLMDIRLPDIGGLEVVKTLREEGSVIPIVALTAYAFETDRTRALAAGCTDYLVKPVRRDLLLGTINKYMSA